MHEFDIIRFTNQDFGGVTDVKKFDWNCNHFVRYLIEAMQCRNRMVIVGNRNCWFDCYDNILL